MTEADGLGAACCLLLFVSWLSMAVGYNVGRFMEARVARKEPDDE